DLTVPLARYYARHREKLPFPFKAIQLGPVWRAERPQKGRYRQFVQCDIDIIGELSEVAEIELITATSEAMLALGFSDFTVRINDRRLLTELATRSGFDRDVHERVFITVDKADKIEMDGVRAELTGQGHPEVAISALIDTLARLRVEGITAWPKDNEVD